MLTEVRQPQSHVGLALWLLLFLVAGVFAIRNIATWPARITYPGDEAYEGVALADMVHLRQGVPIYGAGAKDGFSDGTYGSLYYLLGERLINPAQPSYLPLRVLSILAMLGCAIGCAVLAFWLSRSYWVACLSPLVFLSYGMVTGHGILALSDAGAVFLALTGFLIAYGFRNDGRILLAAPVMILSFYYKPQYIAGPAAVMLFLVIEKRYKLASAFAGILAGCGIGLLGFFQFAVFPGQAYWRHFLFYQVPLLSWHGFVHRTLVATGVFIVLPSLFALEHLRFHRDTLLGCYLFFAVALGLFTYSKDASGLHYFFESILVFSVLLPAVIREKMAVRAHPMDLIAFLAVVLFMAQWQTAAAPQPSDFAEYNVLESFLREHFPRHASSLCASPGEFLQAGLDAPFAGLFQLAMLSRRGVVSDRGLVARIDNGRFALIVTRVDIAHEKNPYWVNFAATPAMLAAIRSHYKLETVLGIPGPLKQTPRDKFYVYVPLNGTPHPTTGWDALESSSQQGSERGSD